ncbi:MAG: hypothetical protein ABI878_10385, partial [Acidobacteriota bacterium]
MTEGTALDASEIVDGAPVESERPTPKERKFDLSITEGPLGRAVWKIAWPTMLTNVIAGMQNLVDQIMVGNLIGYKANAAIGVSNQIFILVIVFISSV